MTTMDALHEMNADPEVMRYISGRPETREETLAMVARVKQRWAEFGYSWWSFIERETGQIVGAARCRTCAERRRLCPTWHARWSSAGACAATAGTGARPD